MQLNDINGIICINKSQGFTSFDVIAKMRGILKMKRLGHSGTLDPMATGVLPVFAGNCTKAVSLIPHTGKSYVAGFRLGIVTDTQDTTGKILSETPVCVSPEQLKNAVEKFVGETEQIPPMYSAVSVGGKRLYELARKGIEVEREARKITVYSFDIIEYNPETHEGKLDISCSGGTYVRTLIHDLGQNLGCGAAMTSLVRTCSNGFRIEECVTLEELEKLRDDGQLHTVIRSVERLFEELPKLHLNEMKTKMYKNGVKLHLDKLRGFDGKEQYRVYSDKNEFLGLASADIENNELRVLKNL